MRIAIFGSGAVGCTLGARFIEAGEDVVFIARGKTLKALREDGITLQSDLGDLRVEEVQATDSPSSVGAVDAVILSVKSRQVVEAAEAMKPLIGPETCVLPLQNGVEAPAKLSEVLGAEHVLGGTAWMIAEADAPGRIRHAAKEPHIVLGERPSVASSSRSERVERLADALRRSRSIAVIPDDVRVAMWEKLLFISIFSGMGAVTRMPAEAWRSLKQTRSMAEEMGREIAAVAAARGIVLPENAVARAMSFVDILPAEATSSMQRDIMEGRPSELEAQNGAVVRLGRAAKVPTPVNRFIYTVLLPQEEAARRR